MGSGEEYTSPEDALKACLRYAYRMRHDKGHHLDRGNAEQIIRVTEKALSDAAKIKHVDGQIYSAAVQSCDRLRAERDEALAALARSEGERERLRGLVKSAFNEGFSEGMNDVLRSRGGKDWHDSDARAALRAEPHRTNESGDPKVAAGACPECGSQIMPDETVERKTAALREEPDNG